MEAGFAMETACKPRPLAEAERSGQVMEIKNGSHLGEKPKPASRIQGPNNNILLFGIYIAAAIF